MTGVRPCTNCPTQAFVGGACRTAPARESTPRPAGRQAVAAISQDRDVRPPPPVPADRLYCLEDCSPGDLPAPCTRLRSRAPYPLKKPPPPAGPASATDRQEKDLACQGGFPRINVSDEHDVQVVSADGFPSWCKFENARWHRGLAWRRLSAARCWRLPLPGLLHERLLERLHDSAFIQRRHRLLHHRCRCRCRRGHGCDLWFRHRRRRCHWFGCRP